MTVKERLQVLYPGNGANAYDEFSTCPSESLRQKLNQAEVLVENWHTLMPAREQERSVVKKGRQTDEVFTREVLGRLARHRDIVVINDEAHHAYRKPADVKISKADAERLGLNLDEATRWIEGLDRIHNTRRIRRCFDLSATPFAPTGKTNSEEGLFSWIVSDFGLTDAIEAGLVKTPRVVIRDDALPDAKSYRSKLYHLYRDPDVQQDLNRRGAEEFREQRIVFQAARKAFDQLAGKFTGNREYLVFQLIRLVEQFLGSKKLVIPSLFHAEGVRRRILVALNMDLVVQHVVKHVEQQNVASIEPVFDPEQPIGTTRAMRTWYTTKGNQPTRKSQISHVVGDSSWEIYAATLFDASDKVNAYAKNDHLGFQIYYLWGGSRKRFIPDFIVRLANGRNLVLEIKGEDSPMNSAKRDALALWVRAVNAKGGFGTWCCDVAFKPAEIQDILCRHVAGEQSSPNPQEFQLVPSAPRLV